jgi:threonine dehydratase
MPKVSCVSLFLRIFIIRSGDAFWNDLRVIAEPGGATAIAASLSRVYQPAPGERVGVVICGGNTYPGLLV